MRLALAVIVGLCATNAAACSSAVSSGTDRIEVVDGNGNPLRKALVFLSGSRWGGCACEFLNGSAHEVQNITSGSSLAAAQSPDHALVFEPDLGWDHIDGEVRTLTTGPPVRLKLVVWILSATSSAHQVVQREVDGIARAFADEWTGIEFDVDIKDRSHLGLEEVGCYDRQPLAGDFDTTAVNVYYADRPGCGGFACAEPNGWSCADDPRWNFVYTTAGPNVMLHEVGHAFLGGSHWNTSLVGTDNLMNDGGSTRTAITVGQAIAMNYDARSVLVQLGKRTSSYECPLLCPPWELDSAWSSCTSVVPPKQGVPARVSPEAVVEAWFACVECREGQLERLLARRDEETLTRLARPLQVGGALEPAVLEVEEVYRPNVLAGRQRRALMALSLWASRGFDQARSVIATAYLNREGYRADVARAAERAYLTLQPQ